VRPFSRAVALVPHGEQVTLAEPVAARQELSSLGPAARVYIKARPERSQARGGDVLPSWTLEASGRKDSLCVVFNGMKAIKIL